MQRAGLMLGSPAFAHNTVIPPLFSCKGKNINPPLVLSNIPQNTKSLALIVHDPDAIGGDFTHWLLWNIPPDTAQIAENSTPSEAIVGTNDAGETSYLGPCPPAGTGTHRYLFELYALDAKLTLPSTTKRPVLEQLIEKHILSHKKLIGLFAAE